MFFFIVDDGNVCVLLLGVEEGWRFQMMMFDVIECKCDCVWSLGEVQLFLRGVEGILKVKGRKMLGYIILYIQLGVRRWCWQS